MNSEKVMKGAGDGAVFCWENTATYSRTRINAILQYLRSQSTNPKPATRFSKLSDFIKPPNTSFEKLNNCVKKCRSMMTEENGIARRAIWFSLAYCSWHFCSVLIFVDTNIKEWLLQQLWKVKTLNEVKKWLTKQLEENQELKRVVVCSAVFLTLLVYCSYMFFLMYQAFYLKNKRPLKLTPFRKSLLKGMFVLGCLGVTYFVKDFWGMLFGFGICFHIIPLLNLLGSNENFGFLDCFLALLIEVGLCFGKNNPNYYALFVVAIISAAAGMQFLRRRYYGPPKETFQLEKQCSNMQNRETQTLLPLKREDKSIKIIISGGENEYKVAR